MPNTKDYRYKVLPGSNNKHTMNYKEIQNPAYASSVALIAGSDASEKIIVEMQLLTGALTLTMDTTIPHPMDELTIVLPSDATGRTTTFSTGFTTTASTIVGTANAVCVVKFIFSSTTRIWVEVSRAIN